MAVNIENYNTIKKQLAEKDVTLVAVSKTKTVEEILQLYDLGQRDFGENYVQELVNKYEALPKDIRWHFIGHLQTNKVKYIAPFVHLIHGIDSEKLLSEINKQGAKLNRIVPCLLQVYISKDETKFGFDAQELKTLITQIMRKEVTYPQVAIRGLMGMATFTEDNALILAEFTSLKLLYENAKTQLLTINHQIPVLSMGMSADYMVAIQAGSNMVRIGSLLFGVRN